MRPNHPDGESGSPSVRQERPKPEESSFSGRDETGKRESMVANQKNGVCVAAAIHGRRVVGADPSFEIDLSRHLASSYSSSALIEHYGRFANGDGEMDSLMRRAIWRAVARKYGDGVQIGVGVGFKHLETFEIGDGVFIGAHAFIQGRYDGITKIGTQVWIGPQAYLDARDLILEDNVGWGPGAKVLGACHTGHPFDQPIIRTDLEMGRVRVEKDADVGMGAIVLPGITIGQGSIVGAGAVITHDVAAFSIVAGIPARFLRWREGFQPRGETHEP